MTSIVVMWSSLIALQDAIPRCTGRLVCILSGHGIDGPVYHTRYLAIQTIGASILLLFLMKNFVVFIDFATGTGLVAAPAVAYYNYRAVTSEEVAKDYRPGRNLTIWNWISFAAMAIFAFGFLWFRFT